MEFQANSHQEMHRFAASLLRSIGETNTLALHGDLGSGKTTFTQGLAEELQITETVTSPTFLLLKQYNCQHKKFSSLIHVDLYRIQTWDDLAEIPLDEFWSNPTNLVAIEWPERIEKHLPALTMHIQFEHISETKRKITF